jgi:hypothetical protein
MLYQQQKPIEIITLLIKKMERFLVCPVRRFLRSFRCHLLIMYVKKQVVSLHVTKI